MNGIKQQWQIVREKFWEVIHNRLLFQTRVLSLILLITGVSTLLLPESYVSGLSFPPSWVLSSTTMMVPLVILVLGAFFYKFKHYIDLNEHDGNNERNRVMRDKFRTTLLHLAILIGFSIYYPLLFQTIIDWNQSVIHSISLIYAMSIFIILYESWLLGLHATGIDYNISFGIHTHTNSSIDLSSSQQIQ